MSAEKFKNPFKKILPLIVAMAFILPLAISVIAFGDGYDNQIVTNGANQSYEDGKVQISKIATQTAENEFDIKLSIDTQDEITHYIQSSSADVVLLIDTSYSMIRNDSGNEDRLTPAKAAAVSFVQKMLGTDGSANNRIAVATFNTTGHQIKTLSNDATALTTAISGIQVDTSNYGNNSYTNTQAGLAQAQSLLSSGTNAQQFVVVFSDGIPTRSYQGTAGVTSTDIPRLASLGGSNYGFRITAFNSTLKGSGVSYTFSPSYNVNISGTNYSVSDHMLPTLSQAYLLKHSAKPLEIYSVLFMSTGDDDYSAGSYLMQNVATDADHFINTSNLDELAEIFQDISTEIIEKTNVWKITDPMGQFMEFVGVTAQTGASNPTAGITAPTNDNDQTLSWNLLASGVTPEVLGANHYRYTLTYHVRLRPDWSYTEGGNQVVFAENTAYPTNGTTTLKYFIGDTFDPAAVKSADFTIPTVNGTLPMVNYTIEHDYYTSTDGGTPELDGFYTDPTTYSLKLWSTVDAATIAAITQISTYGGETYTYQQTTQTHTPFTLTDVNGIYKISLQYQRNVVTPKYADVTVNHHYTEYNEFDPSDPNNILSQSVSQVIDYHQEAGKPYTAALVPNGYTFDSANPGNYTITVNENSANNVIDLYYTKTTQTTTSLTVKHIFVTRAQEDGHELSRTESTQAFTGIPYPYPYSTLGAYNVYPLPVEQRNGFVLDDNQANPTQLTSFQDSGNVVTFYYSKLVPTTASVTVTHEYRVYYNEITDIDADVAEQRITNTLPAVTGRDVGSSYTADIVNRTGFTFVSSNPADRTIASLAAGSNAITLYYSKIIPTQNCATVRHIYKTYADTYDADPIETLENVVTEHDIDITYQEDPGTGEWVPVYGTYTAETQTDYNGHTYIQDNVSPSLTIDLTGNAADNVITITYKRIVQTKTSVTVKHIYTAYDQDDHSTVVPSEGYMRTDTIPDLLLGEDSSYRADAAEENGFTLVNPGQTSQTLAPLAASGNEIIFNYYKYVPTKADVTVRHIYNTYDEYGQLRNQEIVNDIHQDQTIGEGFTGLAEIKTGFALVAGEPSSKDITVEASNNLIVFNYEKTAYVTGVKKEAALYTLPPAGLDPDDYSYITSWQDDTLPVLTGADVIFRVTITGDPYATYKLKDVFPGFNFDERIGLLDSTGHAYEYYTILWNQLYEALGEKETGSVENLAWNNLNSGSLGDNANAPDTGEDNDDVTVQVNAIMKYDIHYLPGASAVSNMPSDVLDQEADDSETVSNQTPTRRGYTFAGWAVDVDGIPATPGAAFPMPASDVNFTAQWSKNHNPSNPTYFDLTVKYLDGDTGKALADPYELRLHDGSSYDVADKTKLEIPGYTQSGIEGDPVSGTIDSDLVIKVYYKANEVIVDEPKTPQSPAIPVAPTAPEPRPGDGIIIIDDNTPLGELPNTGTTPVQTSPFGPFGAYLVPPSLEESLGLKKEESDDQD